MTIRTLPLVAVASLLALAACNSEPKAPQVIDTNPDPMANTLAHAKPVELPPAIKADKSLRCKDNSLVYVTFFEGDKMALVRTTQGGTPTKLTATATGAPLTADGGWKMTGTPTKLTATAAGAPLTADGGWKMTGTPNSIDLTQPGKGSQSCKS